MSHVYKCVFDFILGLGVSGDLFYSHKNINKQQSVS